MSDLAIIDRSPQAMAIANLAEYADEACGTLAPNTERAIRADTAIFTTWCAKRGLASLPAGPKTVAAFVDDMGAARAPATVRRYVSSISHLHRAAKAENPTITSTVKNALKRMHRGKSRKQAQVGPLTRSEFDRTGAVTKIGYIDRMLALPADGPRSIRNRALLGLAYDTLCRRSELVALERVDLQLFPDGDGAVTIRRGKTDQEGNGSVRYVAVDTMRGLTAWIAVAGIQEGPLFRSVDKAGRIGARLDPGDVARLFKQMALAADVPAAEVARISGHSTRVGSAQDMVGLGMELPAIMQAGDWKTPEMVARYARALEVKRGASAKMVALQHRA
jgi:integrase